MVLLRRGTQLRDAAVADVDHVVVTAWYCLGMWFVDSCERADGARRKAGRTRPRDRYLRRRTGTCWSAAGCAAEAEGGHAYL
jgi:hypothetical protein